VLVRQALNYATDKQAIVKAVFLDWQRGKIADPRQYAGYKKDLPDYDYDPQKAKALLKQAGLERGRGHLWSMPVQRPYNPTPRIAEMIQNDWSKVGSKPKSSLMNGVNTSPACAKASTTARCLAGCLTTAIRITSPAPC
jgi:ABC-type transport system substrate-binding protein